MAWWENWIPRKGLIVSHTWNLGSGYNVVADITDRVAALNKLIAQAVADPRWISTADGTTYCNFFCQQIAKGFDIVDLDNADGTPMLAAAAGEHLLCLINAAREAEKTDCKWRTDSAERAVAHAKKGGFTLGWAPAREGGHHGHVVVVSPKDMERSASFNCEVPVCASIAPYSSDPAIKNREDRVSAFYRADNKPIYFLYDVDEDA